MSRLSTDACRDCGAPIVLVLVIPLHLVAGRPRRRIPLDPDMPTDQAPSHAVSPGWTTCRPITVDHPIDASLEYPAITHFATCPARTTHRASTAPEGRTP